MQVIDPLVVLDPAEMSVEPGQEVVCRVHIRNRGAVVEEFVTTVIGGAAAWTTGDAATLRLFPDEEGDVVVRFRPPRVAQLAPGRMPFGVRVVPQSTGDERWAVVEEGMLTITPFVDVAADIFPRRSKGRLRGKHRLTLVNHGNASTTAALTFADPQGAVRVLFNPTSLEAPPGGTVSAKVRVRPVRPLVTGAPELHGFVVGVQPATAPPIELEAAMQHRRLYPTQLPIMLLALFLLLLGGCALHAHNSGPHTFATLAGAAGAQSSSASASAAGGAGGAGGGGAAAGGGAGAVGGAVQSSTSSTTSTTASHSVTTQPSPRATAPPTSPPVPRRTYYYPFDGSGADTDNGQNATVGPGVAYGPGDTNAGYDRGLQFEAGGSVTFPTVVGQFGVSPFSVGFYVQTSGTTAYSMLGNRTVCSHGQFWDLRMEANGDLLLELDDNPNAATFDPAKYIELSSTRPVNDGAWHSILLTRSGSTVAIYIDGAAAGDAVATQPIDVTNQNPTVLGQDGCTGKDGSASFIGGIDDLEVSYGS